MLLNTTREKNAQAMRRTHQAAEPLESSRDPHMGVDLDKNAPRGVDVNLQQARLVERRV